MMSSRIGACAFPRMAASFVTVEAAVSALRGDDAAPTSLRLADNSIGDAGAAALAEAVKVSATLTTLHLGGNGIGADGAAALAEAVKVSASLTTLHLTDNSIGAAGAAALAEAVKISVTLTALAHTPLD